MPKTLHVLNGDSTLWSIEQTDISGNKLVWRDVLSDGPVTADFASQEFWEMRTKYMEEAFGVKPEEFKEKCIDEFRKLEKLEDDDEVVLWFEYDLFCQVNMLGVLHYLAGKNDQNFQTSLVCVGETPGSDSLVGLGEIPAESYPDLFEKRIFLDAEDLDYASKVYLAYCDTDPRSIQLVLEDHSKFPYFKGAFEAHFKRFPFSDSGLTEIEQALLETIKAGAKTPREAVGQILQWQKGTYYGFGDTQYFNYLKLLHPVINNDFTLVDDGSQPSISRDYQMGGARVSDWVWDENQGKLIHS